jgi:hypothetical protein
MKTIDTKSLLLGVLATALVFTFISSKSLEGNNDIAFLTLPAGFGAYNKTTKIIYVYKAATMSVGIKETPPDVYKLAEDGSSLVKK